MTAGITSASSAVRLSPDELQALSGGEWVEVCKVAEEIARSLEKNGMLKMKGNSIKWKG